MHATAPQALATAAVAIAAAAVVAGPQTEPRPTSASAADREPSYRVGAASCPPSLFPFLRRRFLARRHCPPGGSRLGRPGVRLRGSGSSRRVRRAPAPPPRPAARQVRRRRPREAGGPPPSRCNTDDRGTPAAADLVDEESSPQLYAASQQFLAADQAIAEVDRQKRCSPGSSRAPPRPRSSTGRWATTWPAPSRWRPPGTRASTHSRRTPRPKQRLVDDSAARADERHGPSSSGSSRCAEFERSPPATSRQAGSGRRNSRLTGLAGSARPPCKPCRRARQRRRTQPGAIAESGQLGSQIDALRGLARQRQGAGHWHLRARWTASSPRCSGCGSTRSCTTQAAHRHGLRRRLGDPRADDGWLP